MVEALRSLRFAARFVSGYTYSPKYGADRLDDYTTHVWIQVYLPGCGWIDLDPTNDATGNRDLIPVAVVRDHTQAPLPVRKLCRAVGRMYRKDVQGLGYAISGY